MLQPTYVCSLTSRTANASASSANSAMPCSLSSTVLGSPVVAGAPWSPRSTDAVTVQRLGLNSVASWAASSALTVPSACHLMPQLSRSGTSCSGHHHQPRPLSIHPFISSDCSLPTSIGNLAGRLVAGLSADVVKSLLESDSSGGSCQTMRMLLDTVTALKTSAGVVDGGDVARKFVSNCPQFDSGVEELASSFAQLEAAKMITRQSIGRWRSMPRLNQSTEHEAAAAAAFVTVPSGSPTPSVVRSLGQLQHCPGRQLTDQASNFYRYV